MSEALMTAVRPMCELAEKLRQANDRGISFQTISNEAKVNRAQISQLANNGSAILSREKQEALWQWVDTYEARDAEGAAPAAATAYKNELEIFATASYTEGLGVCKFTQQHRGFTLIVGAPGVGKTTLVKKLPDILPRAVCLEAWPMMRLGDLLNEIAAGISIRISGSLMNKTRQIERALAGTDTTLVIDEAEMLHKWDNDKLEVLRKIWDHTGISIILLGTQKALDVVNRMDTTQLSRRMYKLQLRGASAKEVRRELTAYNIDDDAADALAAIAADTQNGGMGSYSMMMKLCLAFAGGGRITMELLNEARHYKPGLKGGAA